MSKKNVTRSASATEVSARRRALLEADAFKLASDDPDLLARDELRATRLYLEYLKPEILLTEAGIKSTVVVFGSARIQSAEAVEAERASKRTFDSSQAQDEHAELLGRREEQSVYYDEARAFAATVSGEFQKAGRRDLVVVTGGGPGIMEAANRGADDVGARSIGLNIKLPEEQAPNAYISPELCFQFRYFGIRKIHFLLRAKALVAFPGGFGTLDEVFEVLTLIQTGKMDRIPIVLVGESFWKRLIDFDFLAEQRLIAPSDLTLFTVVDSAAAAVQTVREYYAGRPPD